MNIILAPDSYKGSLTAIEVAETMKRAIVNVNHTYKVFIKPMADGGEGTIEAMLASRKGKKISVSCTGPLGDAIQTSYAIFNSDLAVIELASIAGLIQVPKTKRNPDLTTTFGLGEVILDGINKGCTSFIIGLGGSATNDGGLGMLIALGMEAWDENGNKLYGFGSDLHKINKVSLASLDPRVYKIKIKVACDVNNPLCGDKGASKIYGPQKGADGTQVKKYDKALDYYGSLIESEINKSIKNVPGVGAAGGLGFALHAIGANLVSGSKLLSDTIRLETDIKKADLIITGEGKTDAQTLYGKVPSHVATLAKRHGVPVVLLSGSLTEGEIEKVKEKFSGCFSIISSPLTIEESIDQVKSLLYEQTKQIIKLISASKQLN
ncbi:glycerate kinase [Virgibacillus sp. W0181]|uniref:glycerate kinase n=1 Tax=Virgibacillus sp. W0181 TaxID=3391581 RepID=UPI003F4563B1